MYKTLVYGVVIGLSFAGLVYAMAINGYEEKDILLYLAGVLTPLMMYIVHKSIGEVKNEE